MNVVHFNLLIKNAKGQKQFLLYGIMAVTLGFGDAFHLIPRSAALLITGLENYIASLGVGKWITSVTMTVFYVLLYHVWRERYGITGKKNITAVLSFGFYIQVVLFSDAFPLVGILMIPKTCAYVWAVVIGFSAMRKNDTGAAA